MDGQDSLLVKLRELYEKAKKWILYADLVLIMLFLYFDDFLGPIRDALLPVVIISILSILIDTLSSLEKSIAKLGKREYASVIDAIPVLCELAHRSKSPTRLDIIASTGGTTVSSVLPRIVPGCMDNGISIKIHLINPDSKLKDWFPSHWSIEVITIMERIKKEYVGDQIKVDVYYYENIPFVHGIMLDGKHLLMGFFGWDHFAGGVQLSGADRRHIFYQRSDPNSDYFFDLFEDWLNRSPSKLVYSHPARADVPAINNAA